MGEGQDCFPAAQQDQSGARVLAPGARERRPAVDAPATPPQQADVGSHRLVVRDDEDVETTANRRWSCLDYVIDMTCFHGLVIIEHVAIGAGRGVGYTYYCTGP